MFFEDKPSAHASQLLYASGFLFMGATEEQMKILDAANVDHVSYVLILYSIAFLLYLFVNMLLHLYAVNAISTKTDLERANGHVRMTGNAHAPDQRVRDAEEFELHGLGDDSEEEEGDESERLMKGERRAES